MAGYSFVRVGRLTAKHYVDHMRRYATLCALMAFMPALFAMLSSDIESVPDTATLMFIVGAFAIAPVTMNELRRPGTKILTNTLPVSPAERMTFIVLNTSVIYSLLAAVAGFAGLAVAAAMPFVAGDTYVRFVEMGHDLYGRWELHVLIWIISSGSVVVNAFARKRLIESYIVAFVLMVLLIWGLSTAAARMEWHVEWREYYEWIAKTIYCLIPVVLYAAAYVVLRRRQIKW